MQNSNVSRPAIIAGAVALMLGAVVQAQAACSIVQGRGTGASQAEAGQRAYQDASLRLRQAGARAGDQISFSQPMCLYADDFSGVSTLQCQVDASWCTTPVAQLPTPPAPPPAPRPRFNPDIILPPAPVPPYGNNPLAANPGITTVPSYFPAPRKPRFGSRCRVMTAKASARSTHDARALVYHTLDDALRRRAGRTIGGYGVHTEPAGCYRIKARGGKFIQCQMTAQICG